MPNPFPLASGLPPKMTDLIEQLAKLWAHNRERPQPTSRVSEHWDTLVDTWANDHSLPLLIRKVNNNRGSVVNHPSGRVLVPTDNSPASWAFASAILDETPSLENIRKEFTEDKIPVAMIFKSAELAKARYKCTLKGTRNPNSAGWKVAHVDGVGLSNRADVSEIDESTLRKHFRKLMKPSNMFLIPLKYAGLGELPEFCQAIQSLIKPS
jgi:hypothetical protein